MECKTPGAPRPSASRPRPRRPWHALQGAERSVEVEQIRHGRAEEALQRALAEHAAAWSAAVERAHAKADSRAAELLGELRQVEARRAELRSLEAWLDPL